MNPAWEERPGSNKSWGSPEAGGLGVGLGVMQGETRGEYSAMIPRLGRSRW